MAARKDGARVVALLRGINVVGKKKVPMATLRSLAEELGWRSVATYINSGNLVCAASGAPAKLARLLEAAIEEEFGFDVAVIVRTAADWRRYAAGSAFADVEASGPNHLLLALAQEAPPKDVARVLQPYCAGGERVAVRGDALWIHYASGVARSKLTPAVLDRAVGSPVTARNWNTVQALARMLEGS